MGVLNYPVLMVHGMGFRDHKYLNYWGRIPSKLEGAGCRVFYGNQDSNAAIETNAKVLADRIKAHQSSMSLPILREVLISGVR